jgi:hypothetical protein
MNHSDILDKIANIYTLRNTIHKNNYVNICMLVVLLVILGYFHFMIRKLFCDNKFIIKQNDNIYSILLKKCIADNKLQSSSHIVWS